MDLYQTSHLNALVEDSLKFTSAGLFTGVGFHHRWRISARQLHADLKAWGTRSLDVDCSKFAKFTPCPRF